MNHVNKPQKIGENLKYFVLDKDERGRILQGFSKVVSVENVDCSKTICSADVVLIQPLLEGQTYK